MDFDQIAEQQGWNTQSMLWVAMEFISKAGLSDDLARFAKEKADEENEQAKEA